MSKGPSWVVVYTKPDGSAVEVFCATERGAKDYKAMVEKVNPQTQARVEHR